MARYTGEVAKEYVGDKDLAMQYTPVARTLLGSLHEMSGGNESGIRRVLLPDGAAITVSFAGALEKISIDVTKVSEKKEALSRFAFVYTPVGGDHTPTYVGVETTYPGLRIYPPMVINGTVQLVEQAPLLTHKPTIVKTQLGEYVYTQYSKWIDLVNPFPTTNSWLGQDDLFYSAVNHIHGYDVFTFVPTTWRTYPPPSPTPPSIYHQNTSSSMRASYAPYPMWIDNRPKYTAEQNVYKLLTIAKNGKFFAGLADVWQDPYGASALIIGVGVYKSRLVLVRVYEVGVPDTIWHEYTHEVFISVGSIYSSSPLTSFEKIGEQISYFQEASYNWAPQVENGPKNGFFHFEFNESGTEAVGLNYYNYALTYNGGGVFSDFEFGDMSRCYIRITESFGTVQASYHFYSDPGSNKRLVYAGYVKDDELWLMEQYSSGSADYGYYLVTNGVVTETLVSPSESKTVHVLDVKHGLFYVQSHPTWYTNSVEYHPGVAANAQTFLAYDLGFYEKQPTSTPNPYSFGYVVYPDKQGPRSLDYLMQLRATYPSGSGWYQPPGANGYNGRSVYLRHGIGLIGVTK